MKKFILKTLALIIPVVVPAIFMEYMLRQIPNDYSYKKNYLDNHSEEIQILILGASDSYLGVNPVFFPQNTFNVSQVSQSLDLDYKIFTKYHNNFNELKTIILSISYSTYWYRMREHQESWRMKSYVIYYGIKSKSWSENSELLSNDFLITVNRLMKYKLRNECDVVCNSLGWGTIYKSENADDLYQTGKEAALRHAADIFSENKVRVYEENLKIIESFSEFCKQRNINLVFLTTPTYDTYRENIDSKQLEKMIETTNNFVKNHHHCFYLNYFDNSDFVKNDFFDADHLNEIGTEKLSKKIVNDLDSLGLLNTI